MTENGSRAYWTGRAEKEWRHRVVPTDAVRAALDEIANAIQSGVLLASQLEADQAKLRRAIDHVARALATNDAAQILALRAGPVFGRFHG